MKFSISRLIFAAAFLTFALPNFCVAQTRIWTINSRSEVIKGDANGVSIGSNGTITPAPKLTEIYGTGQAYVWSSAIDQTGNVYLGTGGEGRIYKVTPDGKGTLFADLAELNVSALAIGKNNELLAASSPDGKVYSIDSSGKATIYFDPKEKYIWSMAVMKDGSLAVGTGEGGKIFRVKQANATAADSLFYDSSESHIIKVITDKNGVLYAGTDSNGLVLRFDEQGNAFAVLDSPLREIHDLAFAPDGSLYVLAVGESAASAAPAATPTPAVSPKTTTANVKKTAEAAVVKSRYDLSAAKSAVYKIEPSGGDRIIWSSPDVVGFSLNAAQNGGVLLGTSDKGRIYKIENDGSETLLLQSNAGQISTLKNAGNTIFATSSNDGRLFRFGAEALDQGSYESPVLDAGSFADWGRIWWNSAGNVDIQTRSGNTEKPESTWSKWESIPAAARSAQINSPSARFFQWRAILKPGSNTSLSEVNSAYIVKNIAPEILTLTILPANIGLAPNPQPPIDPNIASSGLEPQDLGLSTAPVPPRKIYQRGAVSIQWTAEDRNTDTLVYDVLFAALGSNDYKPLAVGISENFYTLDGLALADGQYRIKIAARDIISNIAADSLSGERISDPIEIDNTQPIITAIGQPVVTNGIVELKFKATDMSGYIVRAEYSVNGGQWKAALPDDGISDSPEEIYTIKIAADPGENTVTLRVFDAGGNVGNGRGVIKRR